VISALRTERANRRVLVTDLLLHGGVLGGEGLDLELQHLEALLEAAHVVHGLLVRTLGLAQRSLERLELVLQQRGRFVSESRWRPDIP
jgi:hypothetical protein